MFRSGKKELDMSGTLPNPKRSIMLSPDSSGTLPMKKGGSATIALSASIENLAADKTMQTGRKKMDLVQQTVTDTKKMLKCPVVLLDGTDREFFVPTDATGDVLVNTVLDTIGIYAKEDREFFSITYLIGNGPEKETVWIVNDKKVGEQLSKMSKNSKFEFRVKFYPNDPNRLNDEQTKYQIACQVRMDILTGRLPCSFLSYVILAAYAVQADVGDYDAEPRTVDYVRQMPLAPTAVQTIEFCERVMELHAALRRLTSAEADTAYLENACKMALFGMHRTKVLVKNCRVLRGRHEHEDEDESGDKAREKSKEKDAGKQEEFSVGVYHGGVAVMNGPLREQRFSWPKIVRIRYLRNMFIIARRPLEGEKSEQEITFKLDDIKQAKRLWKLAAEHHAFFRLREQQGPSRPVLAPRNFKAGRGGQDDLSRERSMSMEALDTSATNDWGTLPDVSRKRRPQNDIRANESLVSQTQIAVSTGSFGSHSGSASNSNTSLNRKNSRASQDDKLSEAPQLTVTAEPSIPPLFGVDAALQDAIRDLLAQALGVIGSGTGALEIDRHEKFAHQVPGSAPASAAQTNDAAGRRSPRELAGKRVAIALWQKQQYDPDTALDEAIGAVLGLDLTANIVDHSIPEPKTTVREREKQPRVMGTAI